MKTPTQKHVLHIALGTSVLLAAWGLARGADAPSLKQAFKGNFYVGTAINRAITTGTGGFRRSPEQVAKDIAQVKEQFNQITAENEMKWERIHPRQGDDDRRRHVYVA